MRGALCAKAGPHRAPAPAHLELLVRQFLAELLRHALQVLEGDLALNEDTERMGERQFRGRSGRAWAGRRTDSSSSNRLKALIISSLVSFSH